MADHNQTFAENSLDGATKKVSFIDDQMNINQEAINERYSLEHWSLDGSDEGYGASSMEQTDVNAQGRHKPGHVSAVFIGTTSEIAADQLLYGGPESGAMSLDTTTGLFQVWSGSSWETYQTPIGAAGFGGFPKLTLDATDFATATGDGWAVAPTTLANVFDDDPATNWDDDDDQGTKLGTNKDRYEHLDLGTIHRGFIEVQATSKKDGAGIVLGAMYDDTSDPFAANSHPGGRSDNTFRKVGCVAPFYGRYPSIHFKTANSEVGYFKISIINVYATEV